MRSRFLIVCLGVAVAVALFAVPGGATGGGSATARGSSASARGRQGLEEVWVLGAKTVWAWTEAETGPIGGGGAQGIELTTDAGLHWSDVTPPGLDIEGGKRWITGLFAANSDDAWVMYGGIGSGSRQTIIATTDRGMSWRVIGLEPGECELDFVSVNDGWCAEIGGAAGSEGVTLFRTTDAARSWKVVSRTSLNSRNPPGGLPFGGDKNIEFTTSRVGWAVFSAPVGIAPLFETENGGRSWIEQNVALPPRNVGRPLRDGNGGWFSGQPVMSGRFGAVGYSLGTRSGPRTIVYFTNDAGRDWRAVVPPGRGKPWLVDAITGRSWRLVYGNQILATDDAGRTWRTITASHTFSALSYSFNSPTPPVVLFTSDKTGWVVQQDTKTSTDTLWRTTDGGRRWHQVTVSSP